LARIWITRSQPFAAQTAALLAARGYDVTAAPLLTITLAAQPSLPSAQDYLIVTSRHGVRALAAQSRLRHWPLICVGDATAAAARKAGFTKAASVSGTAKDIIAWIIDHWPKTASITHISGAHHRGDIIETLGRLGYVKAKRHIFYHSLAAASDPRPSPAPNDYVLLYSPRGAAALAALGLGMQEMTMISLSPAVDAALGEISCKDRFIAEKPNESSLFAHLP
jgi:uroporphyrinogen-III synthase